MNIVDKATETQLKSIQTRTGKTLDQLAEIIRKSGLNKHGEIRDMLKRDLNMGHGDANTLVHTYLKASAPEKAQGSDASDESVLEGIYSGPKAALIPIHRKLMAAIDGFGPFEIAPKKTYISLRRKKQFAMIGPATKSRVEVGLNMKGIPATDRLIALPPGGMCQYKVNVAVPAEVDRELIGWIKQAYESAA